MRVVAGKNVPATWDRNMTKTTFRALERQMGTIASSESYSPLDQWYDSVRDKDLAEFDDRDLGIACRQRLHPEYIVPLVIIGLKSTHQRGLHTTAS
jgi:hypothetical protein